MNSSAILKMIFFTSQTIFGSLANLLIWLANIYSMGKHRALKPVDMIVTHIAFANMLTLISRGLPRIMTMFEVADIVNKSICTAIIYIYRVARAHSITATCTLTVYQLVTISPPTPFWMNLKATILLCIKHIIAMCWVIQMVIYFPVFLPSRYNNTTTSFVAFNIGFCHTSPIRLMVTSIYALISSACDFLVVAMMTFFSGYMLLILKKHNEKMKYFRFSSVRIVAEAKAAKSVIQLVVLYMLFLVVDIVCMIYGAASYDLSLDLIDIRIFLSPCYALFSPLIMVQYNKNNILQLCYIFWKCSDEKVTKEIYVIN